MQNNESEPFKIIHVKILEPVIIDIKSIRNPVIYVLSYSEYA